jgi:hypothetical protein
MRNLSSFLRLFLACTLFLAGLALQFLPSGSSLERDARARERHLQALPEAERPQASLDRDRTEARAEAYLRLFGVLLGGLGLALALLDAAHLAGRPRQEVP